LEKKLIAQEFVQTHEKLQLKDITSKKKKIK